MSDDMMYWYVLFCRTGSEERLVERLKNSISSEDCLPFIPQKTCVFRRKGKETIFQKMCFPGYVFIESDKPAAEFIKYSYPVIHKLKDAYRFLSYGNRFDIAMLEEERIALSMMLGHDKHMDISIGYKEGDSVRVISGALVGNESKILSINKNRHEAVIGISMFGMNVSVSIGLEIIEKIMEAD